MAEYNSSFTGKQIDERLAKVTDLETSVTGKLDANQGAENANKFLGVGEDGQVVPTDAPSSGASSWDDLTDKPDAFPPASHNQAASTITAGTFAGQVVAQSGSQDPGTALIRNIKASTTDLTAGSSSLETGVLYIVYE